MYKALRCTEDLICDVDRYHHTTGKVDKFFSSMLHDTLMASIGYSNRVIMRRQLRPEHYESQGGFVIARFKTSANSHVFGIVDTRDGNNCLFGLSVDPTRLRTLYNAQSITIASKDDFTRYMDRCMGKSRRYIKAQTEDRCQVRMVKTVKALKSVTSDVFSGVPIAHQQLGRVYTSIQPMGVPRQKARGQILFRLITEIAVIKCGTVTVVSLYDYNSRRVMSTLDRDVTDCVASLSAISMLK